MKKTAVLTLGIVAFALPAHALNRYNAPSLTCSRIQSILKEEGAAVLRYPSPRISQLTLYATYAFHSGYCGYDQYAKPTTVPSSDNKRCRVRVCTDNIDQGSGR